MVPVVAAMLIAAPTAAAREKMRHRRSATTTAATTLAEAWNGTSWTLQPTLNPGGASGTTLLAVSCPLATACTAVGYYYVTGGAGVPLAENGDGLAWALQPVPDPVGASFSQLGGVSCTAVTVCTAVGYYTNSAGVPVTLAESWDGTSWTIQPTPNPTGARRSQLMGVSCVSATACTAVGYYINSAGVGAPLAEAWDGASWTIQPTPSAAGGLRAVSCTSASACTAVSYYTTSAGKHVPLVERWDGTSWTIQSAPTPTGALGSVLRGVSCPAITWCTAVGYYTSSSGASLTLAETWQGTSWTIQSATYPSGSTSSMLKSISCASTTLCTAVGNYTDSAGAQRTLAESWHKTNGHKFAWTLQSTPNPGGPIPTLSSVSCTSSSACTAVGSD